MSKATEAIYRWLDFNLEPPSHIQSEASVLQVRILGLLRILVGLIWLFNSWTASASANKHAIAAFIGLPFSSWPVHVVGNGILLLDLFIALALLTGKGMRVALWVGVVYLSVMWFAIAHTGGFNTAAGETDPGIAPIYLILLVLTFAGWRVSHARSRIHEMTRDHARLWIYAMQLAFGFLWAWDALFKWHPYYLTHLVGYLTAAQQGEPSWLAAYEQFWIMTISFIGPVVFAVLAALLEAALSWSLITGRLLRVSLPIGAGYSFVIWSTAEGWGGPYTALGQTGMTGNMFGNAALYALVFVMFMVIYRWPAGQPSD
ncbi:hypothetical protein [Salinisphaera hydrothermalis]|uniref:hypothetical protein n=1 Tax=Salinisphaera hydrothermalis TaxID=563188 RepID=UPI003342A283